MCGDGCGSGGAEPRHVFRLRSVNLISNHPSHYPRPSPTVYNLARSCPVEREHQSTSTMKIAVLTSGGDSAGMNAVVRAVVKAGILKCVLLTAFFPNIGEVED